MAITRIDREALRLLRPQLQAAVKEIEAKTGLKLEFTRGTYGDTFGTFKLEISTVAKDGTVFSREADDFKQYATLYGLEADDLGKEFIAGGGRKFKISGLAMKSRKRPVLAKDVNGKTFKFDARTVKLYLGRPEPKPKLTVTDFPPRPVKGMKVA